MNIDKEIKYYLKNNELDLEKIINDYSPYIETIINNLSHFELNSEDKEEISSDVIFVLWKNQYKLDINKNFSSYIAGVTKNITKNYLKKRRINYDISDFDNHLYQEDKIDFYSEINEKLEKIDNHLNKLKEFDKKIFLDFYYSSKSIKDIAKENNVSEFNIKQRLYRIRKKIRKEV